MIIYNNNNNIYMYGVYIYTRHFLFVICVCICVVCAQYIWHYDNFRYVSRAAIALSAAAEV